MYSLHKTVTKQWVISSYDHHKNIVIVLHDLHEEENTNCVISPQDLDDALYNTFIREQ